jgi:hypothetical protein
VDSFIFPVTHRRIEQGISWAGERQGSLYSACPMMVITTTLMKETICVARTRVAPFSVRDAANAIPIECVINNMYVAAG